ncbi:MAG: EAL domain-containing protein [Betaproteobacteria bacterium]|nr:EAL domain-containing protein [Betaproteobacteria bacterium]
MKLAKPPPAQGTDEEIAALIETLHLTGQRLEELTAGEVDGVADREGRTFLLRHAQEQLRQSEVAKQAAILNALPAHIALLDTQGRIISVNQAWRRFADANLLQGPEHAIGVNYLTICDSARGNDAAEAHQAATGIRSVLDGGENHFSLEYSCHSQTQQRWFLMTVSPLADDHLHGVVVMHLDITERMRLEQEKEQYFKFFRLSINPMCIADPHGCFKQVNPAFLKMTGYSESELIAKPFLEFILPEDRQRTTDEMKRQVDGHVSLNFENRYLCHDGSVVRLSWMAFFDRHEGVTYATANDITERKEAQDRIIQLNRVYAVLSGINALIVRVHDRQELFEEACRIAVTAGGFRMSLICTVDLSAMQIVPVASAGKDEGLLTAIKDILSSSEGATNTMIARAIMEKKTIVSNDSQNDPKVLFAKKYAATGVHSMAILPIIVADEAVGALALYASVSEFFHEAEMKLLTELASDIAFAMDHLNKQERLNYLAYYDVLTGLPNRSLLYDRLNQAVSLARRNASLLAVLFVDLDNFKTVNDTLGHTAGDALLAEVSRRLASCLRDTDTVGRLGGDEFGILLPEIGNNEAAALVARKVINSCQIPYLIEGHELFISASIGITLFPDDAGDADTLIRNADTAMYRAKDLGRNTYQFFTAKMNQSIQDKLQLETDLRHALGKGEFLLHYQPKLSCTSGKITGFEALLRWQHPQRGLVGPDEFIPALENSGLIVPVGEWVLACACAQAKHWHDAGLGVLSMAVNISGRQIEAADLCETVRAALAASGLAPAHLELELTESQLMKDAEGIIDLLKQLKAMGVNLSVDDFGTGYSSLAYLKRFPIDILKIDRAFVRDIVADTNDVSITRAIISLAHNLKLKVVAEGVETEGQLGLLIANHCNEIQGYYFSRPLPAEEATALLHSGRTLDSRMLAGMRRKRTLLLVDDEANILSALKRLLRHDGYDILTALSAAQGMEMLAIHPVDVIISDQRMPGMSGVEFLRRVKTLHPETVRLVLSGYTDLQAVTDAINEGAIYKFLTKPWDDGILRANIEEAFRSKEMADENRRMHAELALAHEQLQKLLASKEQ